MGAWNRIAVAVLLSLVWVPIGASDVSAIPPTSANMAFDDTYRYLDQPVESGEVSRTWMWGPVIHGGGEVYDEAESGWRGVRYHEKSRMEYNPESDDPLWTVTNGLLVVELITGRMQIGDDSFIAHHGADVPVVGDPGNSGSPTYADLAPLLEAGAWQDGTAIIGTLDSGGNVGEDGELEGYGVTAIDVGAPTAHNVASAFWDFMNSTGVIWTERVFEDDELRDKFDEGRLFPNAFYATGYPITEAYWTRSEVGGETKDVLFQCFERRCLTYTPENPDGWLVESGNVGSHYYQWRHLELGYGFAYYGRAFKGLMGSFLYSGYPLNATIGDNDAYFRVELTGINTLGSGDCLATEAWDFVVESLNEQDIAFEGSDTGNWDRRAPYRIWQGNGMETLFNESLVRNGYASVNEIDPDPLFHQQLLDAQDQAQEEGAGIWGACD